MQKTIWIYKFFLTIYFDFNPSYSEHLMSDLIWIKEQILFELTNYFDLLRQVFHRTHIDTLPIFIF